MFPPPSNNFQTAVRGFLFMLIQPPAHPGLESQRCEVFSFPIVSCLISQKLPVSLPISPVLVFRLINACTLLTAVENQP